MSEDKSFELNVHFSNPYEKWKSIEDFNTKFRITSNYHKKNKLILAVDGPISFTNYNSAIATFSVGVFLHKLQDNNVIETKLVGARMYDMDLQNVCTSNKRTPSFILEDLEEGEYIIEPVYRLIYSHDYRGGYSQTSTEDRWAYNYAGARNDDIRRTRMFIGTPEETKHYYTLYGVGNPQNFDGSIRSRPPGECDIDPFTYQSTIELIVYKKE